MGPAWQSTPRLQALPTLPRCPALPRPAPAPRQVDGSSHVVHSEEEAMGTRLTIDSRTCLLSNEHDPSQVRGAGLDCPRPARA